MKLPTIANDSEHEQQHTRTTAPGGRLCRAVFMVSYQSFPIFLAPQNGFFIARWTICLRILKDKWQVFPISLHFSYRVVYNLAFRLFLPLPHWRFRLPCFLNLVAIPEKHEALGQGTFYACLPWRPPFDKSFSSFKIAPYERGGFWLR